MPFIEITETINSIKPDFLENNLNIISSISQYNNITLNELEQKRISIPARRNSTFEMINHKSEGYLQGGWKSESTRLNQIRFYNQVINNESNLTQDGLSTLKYTKVSSTSQEKYSFISVEL